MPTLMIWSLVILLGVFGLFIAVVDTNACIHSKSEIVRVALIQDDEEVTLGVEDNRIGLDVAHGKKDRFGLDSIQERVRLLGKNLKIESAPGQGTRIQATFPLIYRKAEEN